MLGGVLSGDLSHISLSSGCRPVQKIHPNAKCFPMKIEVCGRLHMLIWILRSFMEDVCWMRPLQTAFVPVFFPCT